MKPSIGDAEADEALVRQKVVARHYNSTQSDISHLVTKSNDNGDVISTVQHKQTGTLSQGIFVVRQATRKMQKSCKRKAQFPHQSQPDQNKFDGSTRTKLMQVMISKLLMKPMLIDHLKAKKVFFQALRPDLEKSAYLRCRVVGCTPAATVEFLFVLAFRPMALKRWN